MNHTYRVVFNESTKTYVAVSENEPAKGKSKSVKKAVAAAVALVFGGASGLASAVISDTKEGTNLLIRPQTGTDPSLIGGGTGGGYSIAIGSKAQVDRNYAIAMGVDSKAGGQASVALGSLVQATGHQSIALGTTSLPLTNNNAWATVAKGDQSLAIGLVQSIGRQSTAIGNDVYSGGVGSVAIGSDDTGNKQTKGHEYTIATNHRYGKGGTDVDSVGYVKTNSRDAKHNALYVATVTQGNGAVSVGAHTQSLHHGATAIGSGAVAGMGKATDGAMNTVNLTLQSVRGIQATAVGAQSFAASDRTTALGTNAMAGGENATAVGANSIAYSAKTIAIGDGARAGSNGETDSSKLNKDNVKAPNAIAIGSNANAVAENSLTLGANATTTTNATHGISIGKDANTDVVGGITIGWNAKSSDNRGSRHLSRYNPYNPLTDKSNVKESSRQSNGKTVTTHLVKNAGSTNDNFASVSVVVGPNASAQGGNGSVVMGDRANASAGLSIAIGANAHAANNKDSSGTSTIALGASAYASGNTALAIGRQSAATQDFSQAIGNVAAATGVGSLAVGHSANATGYRAIAIGSSNIKDAGGTVGSTGTQAGTEYQKDSQARASGDDAIAFGAGAQSDSYTSIALGAFSDVESNSNHSMALGNLAKAKHQKAVAIGYAAKTEAETGIAMGANATVTAKNGIGIGTLTTVSGEQSVGVGFTNKISGKTSGAFGNSNTVAQNNTFVVGNKVSTTQANSVILGNESTDRAATTENNANVNGLTYSGFAGQGAAAKGVVSVGKVGGERQIINVAAGKISETSTDAINGSQLYFTQKNLGNLARSTANHLGGNAGINTDGTLKAPTYNLTHGSNVPTKNQTANNVGAALTNLNNYINEGWEVHDKTGKKGTVTPGDKVKFVAGDGATVKVDQETRNGETVITIGATNQVSNTKLDVAGGKINTPNPTDGAKYVNATTVANAVNNVSWELQQGGAKKDDVKAGDKVNFVNGKGTTVSITNEGDTKSNIKIDVDTGDVAFNNGTATTTNPEKIAKAGDVANVTNNATNYVVNKGLNFKGNSADSIHKNLGDTLTIKGGHPNNTDVSDKNTFVEKVGDELIVKFAETPEFKGIKLADNNNVVNLAPNGADNLKLTGSNGNAPVTISNVKAGKDPMDAVNVSQLNALKWKLDVDADAAAGGKVEGKGETVVNDQTVKVVAGKGIQVKKVGTTVTISSTVTPGAPAQNIEFADLNVNQNTGQVNTPQNGDGDKAVNATTVAKAINKSGWIATSDVAEGGEREGDATDELVNPGDKVELIAGKNLKIKQENGKFTYSTKENVSFTHVDSDSISIGNGNNADGSKPIVTLTTDPTSGALKVANKDGNPVKITNVAPAELSEGSKDAVNGSQLYSLGDSVTNIFGGDTAFNKDAGKVEGFKFQVTKEGDNNPVYGTQSPDVHKALTNLNKYVNEGIKVGDNTGNKISTLTPTEQLNFVNSDSVSSNVVVGDNGATNVSFAVKTGTITPEGNKAVVNETGGKIATVGDVANVVNNVAWELQQDGTKKDDVKAGDKVNFVNGKGTTVSITAENDTTSKVQIDVDTAALTGDVTFNNDNGTATAAEPDKLAKAGDVANVTNNATKHVIEKGLKFAGNDGQPVHKNLGDTLTIKGGHGADGVSDKNTFVENVDGNLVVKFAETPEFKGIKLSEGGNTVNLAPNGADNLKLTGGDGNGPVTISNVKDGVEGNDAVNVNQLNALKWKLTVADTGTGKAEGATETEVGSQTVTVVAGDGIGIKQEGTKVTISSNAKGLSYADLTVDNANGKVNEPQGADGDKVVNATTVANAINQSGWIATSDVAEGGEREGNASDELVNPGDKVELIAGKNLKIKQENGKFTYSTKENVSFTHVDSDSISIGNGNN
ncbi:ESPR-type extended signal peptide-containing protein, partial [Conchiformibius steedae]|uniref:ESPR-type extended signal peptide-containing protein n=1 Tax=Conchiformibius steedae TaxID=153493 RepID=UPI00146FB19C